MFRQNASFCKRNIVNNILTFCILCFKIQTKGDRCMIRSLNWWRKI